MSAITQPRMNGREVVRCECGLIQFKAANGLCVKTPCRKPYVDPELTIADVDTSRNEITVNITGTYDFEQKQAEISQYKPRTDTFGKGWVSEDTKTPLVTKAALTGYPIGGLTHAHIACLNELVKGSNYAKIGKVTGYSRSYVKFMIRNAALRLGMTSAQRVLLAIWWGCELFQEGVKSLGLIGDEQAA